MYALLALLAATSASASAGVVGLPANEPVRLSLNGGDYRPGDKVKVEVAPDHDGYLLVFRVDGDGYVRVLFPLDPDLDTYVRGGRRYALRGQHDDASFLADDRGGTGLILSVLSPERFSFAGYATASGQRWDYERLRLADPAGDAESQLLDLVDRMTDRGNFEHDVVGYRVWGPGYESEQPVVVAGAGWGDPYFDTCLACGWRAPGWSISIGSRWSDPWYDPWYGRSWGRAPYGYSGWGAGWGGGWNGWYGWDPYYGTPYRPITVINVPLRPVVPNPIYGTRARVPQGGLAPATGIGRRLTDPLPRPTPTSVGGRPTTTRSRGEAPPPASGSRPPSTVTPPSRSSAPPPPATETERARSRRPSSEGTVGTRSAIPVPTPRVQARGEERPVYRPPAASTTTPRSEPVRREANPGARPVSSPPPRREAPPPPRQSSPPPRQSAPPPAPRPSSPPPSTSRSAPPPPPASSGPARSRSRGPDLR